MTEETIKVVDVHVVADETIRVGDARVVATTGESVVATMGESVVATMGESVVATMGESVVLDETGKGVESEIVGAISGVDSLVSSSSWCSALLLARLEVSKSTGGFDTARLPITPCISANHLKPTKIS